MAEITLIGAINMALGRALADDPDDFYVYFQIGTTLAALGRFEEALSPLTRALELGESEMTREIRLWTYLRLAQSNFSVGEIEPAGTYATRALSGTGQRHRAARSSGSDQQNRKPADRYPESLPYGR